MHRILCGLALALLLALQAGADDSTGTKPSDVRPQPDSTLDRLGKDLAELKKQSEDATSVLKRLSDQLEKLGGLPDKVQTQADELRKLRERLEALELETARLKSDAANARRSYAINPSSARANLQLENTFTLPMTVYVDGIAYSLQPGETRFLEKSAGSFTYEVPGVQAPVRRTLTAGETFVVRIYPR